MGSAVDRYPLWLQRSMDEDPHSFEKFHRELVTNALKKRGVCSNCKAKDCHMKCSKCRSVAYCSRTCQVTDWPNHKIICRHVQHVIQVLSSMTEDTRRRFTAAESSQALCMILRMEGINADFTYFCAAHEEDEIVDYKIFTGVVAGGHLYTPEFSFFRKEIKGPRGQNVEPLPTPEKLKENIRLRWLLETVKTTIFNPPWASWHFDEDTMPIVRQFEIIMYMDKHYVHCDDKEAIIDLYGRKRIEATSKETLESYRKRLDDLIARHTSYDAVREELDKDMMMRVMRLVLQFGSMSG